MHTSKRILLLEDKTHISEVLSNVFRVLDYEVVACDNGNDALLELKMHIPFDLCLIDIHCPGITGLEIIRTMRTQNPHIHTPVMALTTTFKSHEEVKRLSENGVQHFLTTTTPMDEIFYTANQLLYEPHSQKRYGRRVIAKGSVDYLFHGHWSSSECHNLSLTGLFVHSQKKPIIGDIVEIRLKLENQPVIYCHGRVCHTHPIHTINPAYEVIPINGFGVVFKDMKDSDLLRIKQLIDHYFDTLHLPDQS